MTQIEDKLREIEKRANAATAGPWEVFEPERTKPGIEAPYKSIIVYGGDLFDDNCGVQNKNDAPFIAASRTDVPRLIAAVRQRGEQLNSLLAFMPTGSTEAKRLFDSQILAILTSGDQEQEQS